MELASWYYRIIEDIYILIRNVGNAFMATGHYQKAMYDFGTAIRFDDKNPQYYANRGNCMMMLNQINDALAEF